MEPNIHDSTEIGSLSPYNMNKVKMTIYTVFVVRESFEKCLRHRAIPFSLKLDTSVRYPVCGLKVKTSFLGGQTSK